jgi:hypothetical protein
VFWETANAIVLIGLSYLLNYLLSYLLTPWSKILLEKLTGSQLVYEFPALYGT